MGMMMRAAEDIGIAEELTPPLGLPPLAFSLYHSFLYSHCSACALPLSNTHFTPPPPTNSPPNHHRALRYCSPLCSSLDSPLHDHNLLPRLSSQDSSHLRLSLRLLRKFYDGAAPLALDRIGGLLTNYEKFMMMPKDEEEDDDDVLGMIKEGARAMAAVLAGKYGDGEVEEAVMCLVLTNAVEVQDKDGRNVGIAVYDWRFSWINHSCSPNASYQFITIPPSHVVEGESQPRVRIYPATTDGDGCGGDRRSSEGYGPRIVVRSIKGIKKDDEVTIAYTDLLQPKELRQSELFTKYWFNCCCKRCSASPLAYVDRSLQKISVCSLDGLNLTCEENFYSRKATKKLMDFIDSAIDEYLTVNNPESCCQKLEELLTDGFLDEQLKQEPGKSEEIIRLHQLHHLCLNAYTTLASAYRVRASDFLAFNPENSKHQAEAFSMSRISAAYSLLLAVLTHHLFLSETSLVASVANFWKNAGESLVYLSRSSVWNTLWKSQPSISENPSILSHKCYLIVQLDRLEAKSCTSPQDQNVMFGEISRQFVNCIVNLASKLWGFLTSEGRHLKEIKDLIDFRWLLRMEGSVDFETHLACTDTRTVSRVEANDEHTNKEKINLLQLGVHCLIYGAYLSSLCFGQYSLLTREVINLLRSEGIVAV